MSFISDRKLSVNVPSTIIVVIVEALMQLEVGLQLCQHSHSSFRTPFVDLTFRKEVLNVFHSPTK